MKTKTQKILQILLPIISILTLIIIWVVSALIVGNSYVLPSVGETLIAFFGFFKSQEFYSALFGTLLRSVIAFIVSFVIAGGLAILSYKYQSAKKLISPIIAIIRVLPTIAVVLLLSIWTNSFVAPVIVTMLVVLPIAYNNILSALLSIDKAQLDMCRLFGVTEKEVLLKVKLPQIFPPLISTAGGLLSLNLKLMVAAEVLSQTPFSIGDYMQISKLYDRTAIMMALVLTTIIVGLVIELIFNYFSKKVGKWK